MKTLRSLNSQIAKLEAELGQDALEYTKFNSISQALGDLYQERNSLRVELAEKSAAKNAIRKAIAKGNVRNW